MSAETKMIGYALHRLCPKCGKKWIAAIAPQCGPCARRATWAKRRQQPKNIPPEPLHHEKTQNENQTN